jgi:hypothetical protein
VIALPDPADLAAVPVAELPTLVLQLAALLAAASARLAANGHHHGGEPHDDHLLDVREAAARLAVTPNWLRRRPHLPFVVKLSDGTVRYSATGIGRFLAAHRTGG